MLIGVALDQIAHLETAIARLYERIDAVFAASVNEAGVPFTRPRDRLTTITGVGKSTATTSGSPSSGHGTLRGWCCRVLS